MERAKNKKIQEKAKKLPDGPGVYKFLKGKKILYIGKATSLKDRVRSYFGGKIEETRGPLIAKMISEIDDIKFQKTDSVLEALILEANLIKKHQPPANTIDKDDKSFNYVVITKEDWPRVLMVRGRKIEKNNIYDISYKFGPFPNGGQLKEALKIVRKMFPFRDKCIPFIFPSPDQREGHAKRGVGCFNYQIGLCPGVCTGEISKREYAQIIKNIILFFESDKSRLIKNLEKQMKNFAKTREFEKAAKIKKTISALNHIQDISLIKKDPVSNGVFGSGFRIESYDIAHLSGSNMVGAMAVLENGEPKKSDYRKFKIKGQTGADDTKALSEILTRRLSHKEWPLPNLVVIDGGIAQKNIAEKVFQPQKFNISIVSVVKDDKHRPREIMGMSQMAKIVNFGKEELKKQILLANAEAHRFAISFHKHLREKVDKIGKKW